MKRILPLAAVAAFFAAATAVRGATASELKLDWKMTPQAAPTASVTSKTSSSAFFAWSPSVFWSGWMQLATTSPGTILFFK